MSIQYKVVAITPKIVSMQFVSDTTPLVVRGMYEKHERPYVQIASGYHALSHNWPAYSPSRKCLWLPGKREDHDDHELVIPIENWPEVSKLLYACHAVLVKCCPVPIHLEEHFRMDAPYNKHPDAQPAFEAMLACTPYNDDGHREIDLNYSAPMVMSVLKSREVGSIKFDAVIGKDGITINAVNAENNEGDSSNMIKMNKAAVVKELETVKAAFVAAVEAQASDIDGKVAAAYKELKADPKRSSVCVEYIDPASATPMIKQYDEVLAILALSADDTISDTDLNQSCACQIVQMRSVDRQMVALNSNYSKKRITISRG